MIAEVKKGEKIRIVLYRKGWCSVNAPGGVRGWIRRSFLTKEKTQELPRSIPKKVRRKKRRAEYKLLLEQDLDLPAGVSFRGAKRTLYDIESTAAEMDEGKAGNVLKTAVEKLKRRRDADAMTVRLFVKGSPSPYAVAFWAPGRSEEHTSELQSH